MGVKGLQAFMENTRPETCMQVDLREMAMHHGMYHPGSTPTLVVDGMACLRHWYRCQAWVHGGQWQEYLHILQEFVGTFAKAGIRLVFFFDGVVETGKRAEWVKRRLRVGQEIARIFCHLKHHGQQPGREMFCLPSGLATFSLFALKSLGQETWNSVREADYEIAHYAILHNCMGILGQDTDFLIFDSVPYLSISKLRLVKMTTVLYSREKLCQALQLHKSDLPLLACILGNDMVPKCRLQDLRSSCIATYRARCSGAPLCGDDVFAVAQFVSTYRPSREGPWGISRLPLPDEDRTVLEKGVQAYLLPGQRSPWVNGEPSCSSSAFVMERFFTADILQAAKEKHRRAECFMVYNVLHDGVVECSNTMEDEEDSELPPQSLMYRLARERIYGILLPTHRQSGSGSPDPTVEEWFVYPGNLLLEPDLVSPAPLNQPGIGPNLRVLWFGTEPEVKDLRLSTFLAVFDMQELAGEIKKLDVPLIAVICLVTYMALQGSHLCTEDVDAYLSQAVCVGFKSYTDLLCAKVSHVDPRAVQLGSLFVRGLTVLIAANSACGFPFKMEDLMPWKTFDGVLFHSKYLLAHSGRAEEELLEGNASWAALFRHLRELVLGICRAQGKTIRTRYLGSLTGKPMGGEDRRPQHFKGPCPSPTLNSSGPRSSGPGDHVPEHSERPRSRHPNRQRYRLAPSWPQQRNPRPNCP